MLQISDELTHVETAGPITFKNLSLFAIRRPDVTPSEPDYLLLEDAITQGLARITGRALAGPSPK